MTIFVLGTFNTWFIFIKHKYIRTEEIKSILGIQSSGTYFTSICHVISFWIDLLSVNILLMILYSGINNTAPKVIDLYVRIVWDGCSWSSKPESLTFCYLFELLEMNHNPVCSE